MYHKENVYPIGPSAQFFKMFLEPSVRKHFTEYDALAIIEWDVVIAHDSSFQRLYEAAFSTSEPFWMKGSTLVGTEFHDTSALSDMWHVLGHLNGNAICETGAINLAVMYSLVHVAFRSTLHDLRKHWTQPQVLLFLKAKAGVRVLSKHG